jgi:Flp pilus assembly protein protease CpaA
VILFLIGFCMFGPQVLLVGTFPVDLAKGNTGAAAAGFVNFMGYMGAAAGDKITGNLAQTYGWHAAVWFWAACALVGAIIIASLWNVRAERRWKARRPPVRKSFSTGRQRCLIPIKNNSFMRAIIIGAGRGRRLMPMTAETPKCYAEVHGRRLLDWATEGVQGGRQDRQLVFFGGVHK